MLSFLLCGAGAMIIGLQQALKAAEDYLRPALKVVVFLPSTVTDADGALWAGRLPAADPEIESVSFISRQEALQKAQGNPALAKSLILLRENPFPASVVLRYRDSAWLARPEPALSLKTQPQVQELRWDPQVRSTFRALRQWRVWLMRLTAFATIMVFVWSFLGAFRLVVLKAGLRELLTHLGFGILGGSFALLLLGAALRSVDTDAALFRPETLSLWPLVIAPLASMASFGWGMSRES